jgi:membrane protein required for colicin V production
VASSFVIWLLFQFVRGFIDRAKLKDFDRQLGAVFGMAKGVLLCVIITLFAVTLLGDDLRRQIIDSRSGLYIAHLLDRADAVMPEEMHDVLHPYLHHLDGRLDESPSSTFEPSFEETGNELHELEQWLEDQAGQLRTTRDTLPDNDPFYRGPPSDESQGDSFFRRR